MISDHYDIDDPADVELTDERIKIVQSSESAGLKVTTAVNGFEAFQIV